MSVIKNRLDKEIDTSVSFLTDLKNRWSAFVLNETESKLRCNNAYAIWDFNKNFQKSIKKSNSK
jgi:hypothetical protein